MSITDGRLNDDVTWWSVTGGDGFGGDAVANPVLIKAHWSDRQEVFMSQLDRREKVSNALVWVDRDIAFGDYLARGDFTTGNPLPAAVAGAYKIQSYRKTPNLRSLDYVRQAVL